MTSEQARLEDEWVRRGVPQLVSIGRKMQDFAKRYGLTFRANNAGPMIDDYLRTGTRFTARSFSFEEPPTITLAVTTKDGQRLEFDAFHYRSAEQTFLEVLEEETGGFDASVNEDDFDKFTERMKSLARRLKMKLVRQPETGVLVVMDPDTSDGAYLWVHPSMEGSKEEFLVEIYGEEYPFPTYAAAEAAFLGIPARAGAMEAREDEGRLNGRPSRAEIARMQAYLRRRRRGGKKTREAKHLVRNYSVTPKAARRAIASMRECACAREDGGCSCA